MARFDSSCNRYEWGFAYNEGGHSLFIEPMPLEDLDAPATPVPVPLKSSSKKSPKKEKRISEQERL
jgi:hypothetical protein